LRFGEPSIQIGEGPARLKPARRGHWRPVSWCYQKTSRSSTTCGKADGDLREGISHLGVQVPAEGVQGDIVRKPTGIPSGGDERTTSLNERVVGGRCSNEQSKGCNDQADM
jgi:hypothetical protein